MSNKVSGQACIAFCKQTFCVQVVSFSDFHVSYVDGMNLMLAELVLISCVASAKCTTFDETSF